MSSLLRCRSLPALLLPVLVAAVSARQLEAQISEKTEEAARSYVQGIEALNRNDLNRALAAFREAASENSPLAAEGRPYYPALYYLGVTYGLLQRHQDSVEVLERAAARAGSPAQVGFAEARLALARGYYHLGQYPRALDVLAQLEAALNGNEPGGTGRLEQAEIDYLKGMCRYARGDPDGARDSLRAVALSPALPRVTRSLTRQGLPLPQQVLQRISAGVPHERAVALPRQERRPEPRSAPDSRWGLRFRGGAQYDSNLVLQPDGPTAGVVTDESDLGGYVGGEGEFNLYRPRLRGIYSFYQTFSQDFSLGGARPNRESINLQAHDLRLSSWWNPTVAVTVGVEGHVRYLRLGGDGYLREIAAVPFAAFRYGGRYLSRVDYRIADANYFTFFDPERDGRRQQVRFRQYLLMGDGRRQLFGGFAYLRESPDFREPQTSRRSGFPNDYVHTGYELELGARSRLGAGMLIDAVYSYADLDYRFRNSRTRFSGDPRARADGRHRVLVRLRRGLTDSWVATFGYLGVLNDSNIADFAYGRHILSFGFEYCLEGNCLEGNR